MRKGGARGGLRCCERGRAYCGGQGKWPRMMVELGACPDCGESFEAEGGCRE